MAPLMPELTRQIEERTGAKFEIIRAENSLFGPGVTTAGLLVGADMRRELGGRTDLDLVLIPAESINEDGLFLDDDTFEPPPDTLSEPTRELVVGTFKLDGRLMLALDVNQAVDTYRATT